MPRSEIKARLKTVIERLRENKWVSNENLRRSWEAGKLNFGEDTDKMVKQQLDAYSDELLEAEKKEAEKLAAEQKRLLSLLKRLSQDN